MGAADDELGEDDGDKNGKATPTVVPNAAVGTHAHAHMLMPTCLLIQTCSYKHAHALHIPILFTYTHTSSLKIGVVLVFFCSRHRILVFWT